MEKSRARKNTSIESELDVLVSAPEWLIHAQIDIEETVTGVVGRYHGCCYLCLYLCTGVYFHLRLLARPRSNGNSVAMSTLECSDPDSF